jgi:hypothetical protein
LLDTNNFWNKIGSTAGAKGYVKTVAASKESLVMMKVPDKNFHFMQWCPI